MKKTVFIFLLLILFLTILSTIAFAAGNEDKKEPAAAGEPVQLPNPLGTGAEKINIPTLLGNVVNAILGIVGSLALVMFIYGGIIWMTSSGNAEQVTKGKNIVIWATIGLVVIFSAYALVSFVLTKALGVT